MPRRKPDPAALEARIGHAFANRDLLGHALTHMSAAGGAYAKSYQRLEFLGDRVLGLAIAEMLYAAFHRGSEGDLSRRLSELVRRETCADIAEEWGLGPHLRIGSKEAAIRTNRSVLADVTEAVIGAVFLDAGYPAAHAVDREGVRPADEGARQAAVEPEGGAAGMGARPQPADPGLRDGRAVRPPPRAALPHRGQGPGPQAGRGHRLLEARRRAGRGREPPPARRSVEASREAGITGRQDAGARRRAAPRRPRTTGWTMSAPAPETPAPETRCGFVALIGAPNAGKSTLLNALVGSKVSIVSRKVQTTRTRRSRHRHRGRGPDRLRRHARHLRAEAAARPGDGDLGLGRGRGRRRGLPPRRRPQGRRRGERRDPGEARRR